MKQIPVWVSNRHIHLSKKDADVVLGEGYELKVLKDLSQPGQFACEETLTIKWPKWQIDGVRILGPYRRDTQVEIMLWDSFKLWIQAPIRLSGDLDGSPGLEIVGPQGSVVLEKWLIVALRHIHIHTDQLKDYWLVDGQIVKVKFNWPRGLVFEEVVVRANDQSELDFHIDMEEANAWAIKNWDIVELVI